MSKWMESEVDADDNGFRCSCGRWYRFESADGEPREGDEAECSGCEKKYRVSSVDWHASVGLEELRPAAPEEKP